MRLLIALLLTSAGCASKTDNCDFEDSVYTAVYRTLNGDCPDMPLRVISPGAFPPECSQEITYDDKCAVNLVRECKRDGRYGRYVLTLEPRGRDYVGLYQVTGPTDRSRQCSALYDVTYTAQ
ncbi:MAG TPA: hypothetical protein VFN67_27825 [Polyangiales bacterium]|jgi:hypothetical protein|nr:hypothetical protein [Polyangiales bacterium]